MESASYFDQYKEVLEDALNEKQEREIPPIFSALLLTLSSHSYFMH